MSIPCLWSCAHQPGHVFFLNPPLTWFLFFIYELLFWGVDQIWITSGCECTTLPKPTAAPAHRALSPSPVSGDKKPPRASPPVSREGRARPITPSSEKDACSKRRTRAQQDHQSNVPIGNNNLIYGVVRHCTDRTSRRVGMPGGARQDPVTSLYTNSHARAIARARTRGRK